MLKFALPPKATLNMSRWNIGVVGSPMQGAGVGHEDFMLFTSYSLALGNQREPSFQWNTVFTLLTCGQTRSKVLMKKDRTYTLGSQPNGYIPSVCVVRTKDLGL